MYHLNGPTHTEASEEGRKEGLAAACGLFCGLYPSIVCIVLGPWNPNTSPYRHVRVSPPLLSSLAVGSRV